MTPEDQRILDCHAAWVHGCMPTEALLAEVSRLTPETDAEKAMRRYAHALGEAAARETERRAIEMLTR